MRVLILLFTLLAGPLLSEEIVLGLSRNQVNITATFDGSDILIFGAIKRDSPAPTDSELGIIVAVAGPDQPVSVRRKDRRLGIWVNTDVVELPAAPSFYAIATTGPLAQMLDPEQDAKYGISIPQAIGREGHVAQGVNGADFSQALIRIRESQDLYQLHEGLVDLQDDTLFRAEIGLPANLTEGDYAAQIFLTRNGQVIDSYETLIPVAKVGLERWLYTLAHEQSLIYGLLSLFIAIAAGWGASAIFQLFRR